MKNIEIERKFLLRPTLPKKFLKSRAIEYRKLELMQFYLLSDGGEQIRYRKSNDNYYKTIKNGEGLVRQEREFAVTQEEFELYLPSHIGKVIEKKRYVFEYKGFTYELDRFCGALEGLCFIEVEFDDEKRAHDFHLPELFSHLLLAEVTYDSRFQNAALARSDTIPTLVGQGDASDSIAPFESTQSAVKKILISLANRVEQSRVVLLQKGNDTEALHHYRVSMRKLRSFLSLFRECFVSEWVEAQRSRLSELMAQTNAKRDLDVMLCQMESYKIKISPSSHDDCDAIEALIRDEQTSLDNSLDKFAQDEVLMGAIDTIREPQFASGSDSQCDMQPIIFTTIAILHSIIDKIIKKGKKIDGDLEAHEEKFHSLRIDFKNLRYLIEIMKPLIEPSRYIELLKIFKRMQDILGSHHDYALQRSKFTKMLLLQTDCGVERKSVFELMIAEAKNKEIHCEKQFRDEFQGFKRYKKRLKQLFLYY